MGLSDDQKALLRLLAGGQGYEDIAALLGTGVEEVEAKAAAAAEQLEAEGIPAPTLPAAGRSLTPAPADPEPPSDPPSSTAVAPEKGVLPDKAGARQGGEARGRRAGRDSVPLERRPPQAFAPVRSRQARRARRRGDRGGADRRRIDRQRRWRQRSRHDLGRR